MNKKIELLTDAQKLRFQEFIDKWTDIGLCTKPADRSRAEAGVVKSYQIAGLEPPKIVWCSSPLSAGLTRAVFMGLNDPKIEIGDSVRASVWASVLASVLASVRDSVSDSVRDSVWASVWASVRASVGASVSDSVWASVGDSVSDSVRDSVWASVYGQHDASWLGYYDYFAEACGLSEETRKLSGLWEVSRSAGWWLPHEKICWISERHNALNRDERGRLHCVDGMALAYPDGWGIYAIGGVRLDEKVVMSPQKQTADEISGEKNEEVKRIRIERFAGRNKSSAEGWAKYLKAVGAQVVHERRNDAENTREALMRTPDGMTTLVCACPSTARVYALEVPPSVKSCQEAQSYLWSGSKTAERVKKFNIIGRS